MKLVFASGQFSRSEAFRAINAQRTTSKQWKRWRRCFATRRNHPETGGRWAVKPWPCWLICGRNIATWSQRKRRESCTIRTPHLRISSGLRDTLGRLASERLPPGDDQFQYLGSHISLSPYRIVLPSGGLKILSEPVLA